MKRSAAVAAAAGLVLAGTVTLAMAPAGAAASGCRVTYTVSNQWPGGFTAAIAVINLGDPVTNWVLTFDFAAGQRVTQGWSAAWSQSAAQVSAASLPWNGSLGTGASVGIGFTGAWSGSNPSPSMFRLNGTLCTGAVSSPSGSPSSASASPSASSGDRPPVVGITSPNSSSVYGEPGTILLSADASDPDGTVTRVEFYTAGYAGTPFTLVATDVTAPYSFLLTVPTTSVWVVQARAYDNAGLTASDTVRITVAVVDPPPPSQSPSPR
jgi:hypothetical protein